MAPKKAPAARVVSTPARTQRDPRLPRPGQLKRQTTTSQMRSFVTLYVHTPDFSSEELLVNPEFCPDFHPGAILELEQAGDTESEKSRKVILQVPEKAPDSSKFKGQLQISMLKSVADMFKFVSRRDTLVRLASSSASALDYVVVSFKDQYISRSEMWRMKLRLCNKCVYITKTVVLSGVRATVKELMTNGVQVSCGLVTDSTKVVFRSRSCKSFILLQMSREMWTFDSDGDLYFEKAVYGMLRKTLEKWRETGANHNITVIFFARFFYDKGVKDPATTPDEPSAQMNHEGRLYRDYFKVIADSVECSEADNLLLRLKKEFVGFPRLFGWDPKHTKEQQGAPTNSVASKGGLLEAINLCLNVHEKHYLDRNLELTGQTIMLITPGCGVFEVDKELARLTKRRMVDTGVCCDLICLGPQPLHLVPLFIYGSEKSGERNECWESGISPKYEFKVPRFGQIMFYESNPTNNPSGGASFSPSCHMPSALDLQHRAGGPMPITPMVRPGYDMPRTLSEEEMARLGELQDRRYAHDAAVFTTSHSLMNINTRLRMVDSSGSIQSLSSLTNLPMPPSQDLKRVHSEQRSLRETESASSEPQDLAGGNTQSMAGRKNPLPPRPSSVAYGNLKVMGDRPLHRISTGNDLGRLHENEVAVETQLPSSLGNIKSYLPPSPSAPAPNATTPTGMDSTGSILDSAPNRATPSRSQHGTIRRNQSFGNESSASTGEDMESSPASSSGGLANIMGKRMAKGGVMPRSGSNTALNSLTTSPGGHHNRAVNPYRHTRVSLKQSYQTTKRRWTHVSQPQAGGAHGQAGANTDATNPYALDWLSLCEPAILPLTTDYFPVATELKLSYNEYPNTLCLVPEENVYNSDTSLLLKELICQRLAQDFQLVVSAAEATNAHSEARTICLLSSGHQFHKLIYDSVAQNINVLRYLEKSSTDIGLSKNKVTKDYPYTYAVWSEHSQKFLRRQTVLTHQSLEYPWNYLDELLCGEDHDLNSRLKYLRVRFAILPPFTREEGRSAETRSKAVAAFEKFKNSLFSRNKTFTAGGTMEVEMEGIDAPSSELFRGKALKLQSDSFEADRVEWMFLQYGAAFVPAYCYHLELQWLVCTGSVVVETIQMIFRKAKQCGLYVTQIPGEESLSVPSPNPFYQAVHLPVPSFCHLLVQHALLERFDFVVESIIQKRERYTRRYYTGMNSANERSTTASTTKDEECIRINDPYINPFPELHPHQKERLVHYIHRSGQAFVRFTRNASSGDNDEIYWSTNQVSNSNEQASQLLPAFTSYCQAVCVCGGLVSDLVDSVISSLPPGTPPPAPTAEDDFSHAST